MTLGGTQNKKFLCVRKGMEILKDTSEKVKIIGDSPEQAPKSLRSSGKMLKHDSLAFTRCRIQDWGD